MKAPFKSKAPAPYRVPERALRRKHKLETTSWPPVPPRPPPVLGFAAEQNIRDCIVGMQRNATSVGRLRVILKAKEVYEAMFAMTCSVGTISRGWYSGFTRRFPEVVVLKGQIIKHVRDAITHDSVTLLFGRCARHH